ncbi:MAG: energy transducer TonB [Cytophagales bacterium]
MIVFITVALLLLLITTTFLFKFFIHHQKKSDPKINRAGRSVYYLKKNPSVDLVNYRQAIKSAAFVIALLLVITAFEWKDYDSKTIIEFERESKLFEEFIDIPITKIPLPPKPKIVKPKIEEVKETIEEDELIEIDWLNDLDEAATEIIKFEEAPEEIVKVYDSYDKVDRNPGPKQGMKSFLRFIAENYQFPETAKRNGIEGRIVVQFTVNEDGSLSEAQVMKGLCKECDEEALRVISIAPDWIHGMNQGRPIRKKIIVPIVLKFR